MTSKISDGMDAIPGVFCLARKSLWQASDLRAGCAVLLVCLLNQGRLGWAVGEICRREYLLGQSEFQLYLHAFHSGIFI